MFDSLCAFPLGADLFAQAIHPTAPLVTVGLASGHVHALKLPSIAEEGSGAQNSVRRGSSGSSTGTGFIDTAWRTKRHKGSCRCLSYSLDGLQLYSAGSKDDIVKAADSETGRVISKAVIPENSTLRNSTDSSTVIHALSPQTLLLGTDSGALHLYDLRDPSPSHPLSYSSSSSTILSPRPSQTYYPHVDYVSSLTPLPPTENSTSGYSKQWLTTGGMTLSLTDLRQGVIIKSENQNEELLSCLFVTGLPVRRGGTSRRERALVGDGSGVITLWEKGEWHDQDERIIVSREKETLDSLTLLPEGIGGTGKQVAVGMGNGKIRIVKLGLNKVVGEVQHDEAESVVQLGFDASGRMISGGGEIIKVWQEHIEAEEEEEKEKGESSAKRAAGSDVDSEDDDGDDDDDDDDSSDDEEEAPRQRKKKRQKGKGPANVKKFDFAGLD